MSNKKIMKKSKKRVLFAVLVPVMAVAVGISALLGAVFSAGGNKRGPAGNLADGTTAVNSNLINLGENRIDGDSYEGVKALIEYIGGTGKSYDDVANSLNSPKLASAFAAKSVKMGDVVWNVMYVSKADYTANGTEKGDVIVTLWQAASDANYMSAYTPWYADTPNAKYPSAMYGSSLVRSTLIGSSYVATNGATTLTAGTQADHWKQFTNASTATTKGFGEMLATPANMAWQKTQKAPAVMKPAASNTSYKYNYPWYFPNDAWGDIGNTNGSTEVNGGCWYNKSGTGIYNYSDNENNNNGVYKEDSAYTAWKNDKLWLPSMTETGWGNSAMDNDGKNWQNTYGTVGSGLWNASATQRATNVSSGNAQYAWLRSGDVSNADLAYLLDSSGGYNDYGCSNSYAVRPALHLNLKSAAQAAGLFEQPIEYHTSYGKAPVDPDGYYVPGTDTALLSLENTDQIPAGLEFAGWAKGSVDGEIITSLSGQSSPLALYATFKPKKELLSVTTTPANKNLGVNYGATDVTMSAAVSHTLITGGKATVSTYWRYNDEETNLAASAAQDGITLTDGANPSLVLTRPARSRAGKYTLYYTLNPTAEEAAKGVKPLAGDKIDFNLTVYGAACTVVEKPTLSPSQIYVGQPIEGTSLTGGRVSCATANIDNVEGSWHITSLGVFTSSGKIYAKFTPRDKDIAPVEDVEIPTNAIQLSMTVDEDVSGIDGATAATAKSINVDYYTTASYAISGNKITFTVTQDGAPATVDFTLASPVGYTPYLHRSAAVDPDKTEVESGSDILKNVTANKAFTVGYKANEVGVVIYYILDNVNGVYPSGDLEAALGLGYVYKYEGTALTGSTVKYADDEGNPLESSLAGGAGDFAHRELDASMTTVGKVKGDGSTVARIYYKLKEYTVTYSALLSGVSNPTQTKKVKYGGVITEPKNKPSKALTDFMGWSYSNCACEWTKTTKCEHAVNFGTDTVTGDITVYAKFNIKHYSLTFDLNLSDYDDNALPIDDNLSITTQSANLAGGLVSWDHDRLFPDDKKFDWSATNSTGVYTIDYTVENIPQTMSIKNVKPSAIGYTFDGWFLEGSDSTTPVTTIKKPTTNTAKDMRLVAHWSPAKYTLHLNKQDGSFNAITEVPVTNRSLLSEIVELSEDYAPGRAGYTFGGWYITNDPNDEEGRYTVIEDNCYEGDDGSYFSIAKIKSLYGSWEEGYDFSNLSLYAEWNSIDVLIDYVGSTETGRLTFKDSNNQTITITRQPVHIGDVITVVPVPAPGYRFVNITVAGDELDEGVKTFTLRLIDVTENDTVEISAKFVEEQYKITYKGNGGTSGGGNFAMYYTRSQLAAGDVKLSNNLTRRGYDFKGWKFENGRDAYTTTSTKADLRGEDLRLKPATDGDGKIEYRDVTLTAQWEAQAAKVNLYNASYPNDEYGGSQAEGHVIPDLKTDDVINITNPTMQSFVFLGWATTRNGAVVYPASEDVNSVSYTVNADKDENGKALNKNNLYAVWHIKGVDRILMSVENNDCVFGGAGVTMFAKPAQQYEVPSGYDISLTYKWYRIFEGMYDDCFTVGKVFVEEGKVKGYEFNGVYSSDVEGKNVLAAKPAGDEFEYRRFEESKAGECFELKQTNRDMSVSDIARLNILQVNDCCTYVCVVEVVATDDDNTTTRAGGYGEIAISMRKAVYDNLALANAKKEYNTKAQWSAVQLKLGSDEANTSLSKGEDGVWYLSLPDYRYNKQTGAKVENSNSKVIVTYSYYVGEGLSRREITDLNEIKNAGTYYIVVNFAFTPDGDKGNYEPFEPLEAELVITPHAISNVGFVFVHGEDRSINTFTGPYDGVAYSVEAKINDQIGASAATFADADDVKLEVVVSEVTEDGDIECNGATVSAGRYSVRITGVGGADAANYVLSRTVTLRKEYVIGKSEYEVSKHISFNGDEVTFDNQLHSIEIKIDDGYQLPHTVTAKYVVSEYEPEEGSFTTDDHKDDNFNEIGNAGRYAGVYTITVKFEDSAAGNYAEISSMTAKLTIKKANLLSYCAALDTPEDPLADGHFVGGAFSFNAQKSYRPTIDGGRLANKTHVAITYDYYEINEKTGVRRLMDDDEEIQEVGKYEIVANIEYVSSLYMNNFEDITASESTITYVIRNVDVESVVVSFKDTFESAGREVTLGEGFNYEWINKITVTYLDKETNTRSTRILTEAKDIALALITLENGQTTFWHVGSFDIKVGVYGFDSNAYQVNVKQKVSDAQVLYSKNSGVYLPVDEDGIEYEADATYSFRVAFTGVNVSGVEGDVTVNVEAKSALTLGANALQASASDSLSAYYVLPEDLSVNFYKVIDSDVTWQYSSDSTDGVNGTWANVPVNENDSYVLPYIGKEYMIRVTFVDNGTKSCVAKTTGGVAVRNYVKDGYVIVVGRSGNYKIDATTVIEVEKRALTVSWGGDNWNASTNSFVYNGWHQSPTVVSDNIVLGDKGAISYAYQLEDENGRILSQSDVIEVGTYIIKLELDGDSDVCNNYVVNYESEAAHATLTYNIVEAEIVMNVVYSEHTYGTNVTYAGNEHGLRISAMKADFGANPVVAGRFAFIANYNAATGEFDEVDGSTLVSKITNKGTAEIAYAYIPDDGNYKTKIDTLQLEVKKQEALSGTNALLVVFGEDAIRYYLINNEFNSEGIEVYRKYQSYYTEGDEWYGYRGKPIDAKLTIGGNTANGYLISETDVSQGMIVLLAISNSNTGTLEIPVMNKRAVELKIISKTHRTVFYIGEKYDFKDMEFRAVFADDTYQDGLKQGSVKSDFDGRTFDTAGTKEITFTYLNAVTCKTTVTVQEKEDLTVIQPTDVVLTWTGERLPAPELTFLDKDSKPVTEGISVEVAVQQNNRPATLKDEGTYSVQYAITVTNPRFNKITKAVVVEVKVTKNPYKVDIDLPKGEALKATYTGSAIELPKPVVGEVTDATNNNMVVESRVKYNVAGVETYSLTDGCWKKTNAGSFKVTITVEVRKDGVWQSEPAATAEYTFVIEQAKNGHLEIEKDIVILGDGANFKFPVTANFGANTAKYEYSKTGAEGSWTVEVPNEAGRWFVKVTIDATDNYTGISDKTQFEVRANSIDAGDKGSVSGGDGLGDGWTLEINETDVSGESVNKQNVHEGYSVVLKDEGGTSVTPESEYTVRVKLSDALSSRKDLKVFYKDTTGKTVEKKAVVKDGYIEFQTKDFGTFIITSAVAGVPVGLIVGVAICAVVAAAMIAACIIVFLKKRKRGAQ